MQRLLGNTGWAFMAIVKPAAVLVATVVCLAALGTQRAVHAQIVLDSNTVIDASHSFPNSGIEVVGGENPPTVIDVVEGGEVATTSYDTSLARDSSVINVSGGQIGRLELLDGSRLNVSAGSAGGDDGKESAKDVGNREERRDEVETSMHRSFAAAAFDLRDPHAESAPARRARADSPARTRSPSSTSTVAVSGRNTSTRDPYRIRPIRSPRITESPGLWSNTMRRATSPAICLRATRPFGPSQTDRFCSFSSDAFSLNAENLRPAL